MVSVQFSDNLQRRLLPNLKSGIVEAQDARIAVAFLKKSGLDLVEDALLQAKSRGSRLEVIVGLDFQITEARALLRLHEIAIPFYCYVSRPTDDMPSFHPKLYILSGSERAHVILGSSNLTAGGLKDNIEFNAELTLNIGDELLSDIYASYNQLKFLRGCRVPDEEFIREYGEAAERVKRIERVGRNRREARAAVTRIKAKESELPRPPISSHELFGWQKLVYEKLPEGPFRLRDLYKREAAFREHYPDNQHINDKVRQILQQLRDLGLVRNLARGTWTK
jgi:HKD family nuclease